MPFYLTRDPVPSADMRNVFDNAQNLDFALNDITSLLWKDRLGKERKTWFGIESEFDFKMEHFDSVFSSYLSKQEYEFSASQKDKEQQFQKFLEGSGYVFIGDYEGGPYQFTARNQYIRYNNQFYRLNVTTDVGFTTTGISAESFSSDLNHFVLMDGDTLRQVLAAEGGSQLIFGLGYIVNTSELIFSSKETPSAYRSNGFYEQCDGGEATWQYTGNTIPEKAGTHAITEGKIYNANGDEYALEIRGGAIKVLANGAKAYTYNECTDQTTDDFVCLGQASNGILSRLTLGVSTGNNVATYDGGARLDLIYPTNMYRIGKEPVKGYSGVNYCFGSSYLMVYAGKSYTYAMTGKRLDGWRHGVPEIEEKWRAVNKQEYWGSLSLQNCHIYGGTWDGDHTIRKMPEQCSSGVAILALNPEGFFTHGVTIKATFNWAQVEMPAMLEPTKFNRDGHAFDNNELDYEYITSAIAASGATRRAGNFNRVVHDGSKFEGGRRGTYRNACDWTALYNTEVTMRQAWRSANNVSGTLPEYIAVMTGTGLHVSGGYWGPAAAKDYNAKNGVVYGTAQNHVFTGVYNEWTYNFYTVSRWGFIGKASRLLGLHFDCVSMYKDNFTEYSNVRFEGGCFPSVDDGGNAKYHDDFWHYDTPNGVSTFIWGNPVRDLGAFRHTGFDFRYGTNNMYIPAGTDWDSIRNRPYAKEMFNPNGLQLNAGPAMAPWQQPSIKSEICIWIKDHTGNFNPRNIYAWVTAASQDGPNADEALYKSFAEPFIDFGNGYRMLKITNKRLTA
ncbi:hypothetical protein ACRFBM_11300, partial [Klebsiella pneumoniae]